MAANAAAGGAGGGAAASAAQGRAADAEMGSDSGELTPAQEIANEVAAAPARPDPIVSAEVMLTLCKDAELFATRVAKVAAELAHHAGHPTITEADMALALSLVAPHLESKPPVPLAAEEHVRRDKLKRKYAQTLERQAKRATAT